MGGGENREKQTFWGIDIVIASDSPGFCVPSSPSSSSSCFIPLMKISTAGHMCVQIPQSRKNETKENEKKRDEIRDIGTRKKSKTHDGLLTNRSLSSPALFCCVILQQHVSNRKKRTEKETSCFSRCSVDVILSFSLLFFEVIDFGPSLYLSYSVPPLPNFRLPGEKKPPFQ